MADRFISREWLLKTINGYKNIKTWNTEVCDPDTVLRVLQVVENLVKGAPDIGPMQYGNIMLAAKNIALKLELELTSRRIEEHLNDYRRHESSNDLFTMAFYIGLVTAEREKRDWLERMVQDGGVCNVHSDQ